MTLRLQMCELEKLVKMLVNRFINLLVKNLFVSAGG